MPDTDPISDQIESLILQHGRRGIEGIRSALVPGYCRRAAEAILAHPEGVILIGSGFWVAGTFETDGPIGAIALYQALEPLGYRPLFVCAPPLYPVLACSWRACSFPILDHAASLTAAQAILRNQDPALIVSIERPGITRDGRYYNMRRQDITAHIARFDLLLELGHCPSIAIGDGGNEIGMGKVLPALAELDIIPSVTSCDELIIATVSNWGVYGILAELSRHLGTDLLAGIDSAAIAAYLIGHGAIDGLTGQSHPSEDGLPLAIGETVIAQLRQTLTAIR